MFVADGKLIDQIVDCLKKYLQLSSYLLRLQPVAFEPLKFCVILFQSQMSYSHVRSYSMRPRIFLTKGQIVAPPRDSWYLLPRNFMYASQVDTVISSVRRLNCLEDSLGIFRA